MFAANNFDDNVAVVDTQTDQVITRIPVGLPGGLGGPRTVAITPDLTRAYVTLLHDHGIAVIDTHTLQAVDVNPAVDKVETTINIEGARPYGAVADKDGKYLYVSDFNVGTVYVVDIDPTSAKFHTVVKRISVDVATEGLRGMDITADGRRLYVAAPLKGGAAAFSKDQYPNGNIVVIDTDTTPGSKTLWTVVTHRQVAQEPYAVKASATDPTRVTFTNRRSDGQGFGIIHATNSAHSSLSISYAPLTLGSKLDSFDVNDASSIAILPAGTLPNQTKTYAFVTGWNRIQQGEPSRDPFLREALSLEERVSAGLVLVTAVGGNVGVIEDPFGTNPKLVAATSGQFLGMPDGLALSADGLTLYAAFSGENAVRRFDVQLLLNTMAAHPGGTVRRNDGTFTTLATTPLAGPDFPGIHAYHPLNQAIEFSPIGTGRFPQGLAIAESSKVTIGFGRENNAISTEILGTAEPGDTTPVFRWKVDWADQTVRNGATSKLYLSVFPPGKGLFPSDFNGGDIDATKDLGRHRILNGVSAVHRFTQDGDLFEFDLEPEVARALTLGQTYYIGVKIYDGTGNVISTASRSFKLEQAAPTDFTKFSSVTVLTHGFQPGLATKGNSSLVGEGQWLFDMAKQIVNAGGGNQGRNILRYDKASGNWLDSEGSTAPVSGGPLVLISDWWRESDINDSGFSEAAGDAFFASLVKLNNNSTMPAKIFDSPLHFIAHSRGTVVTSELLQRLGEYENRVLSQQPGYRPLNIQLTTLDIHDEFFGAQANLRPLGINWTDFDEPSVYAWTNIDYADNYYQGLSQTHFTVPINQSASPDGRVLPSADLNVSLNGLAGFMADDANVSLRDLSNKHYFLGPHSRVWRWYAGTTDLTIDHFELNTPNNEPIFRSLTDIPRFTPPSRVILTPFGFATVQPEPIGGGGDQPWYAPKGFEPGAADTPWEGIGTGWAFSELGGLAGARTVTLSIRQNLSFDNTEASSKITPDQVFWTGSAIPSVINGNFELGNMSRGSRVYYRGDQIPGWSFQGGTSGAGAITGASDAPQKPVYLFSASESIFGSNEGAGRIVNLSGNHALELSARFEDNTVTHNYMLVPEGADRLRFKVKVSHPSADGDILQVFMNEVLLDTRPAGALAVDLAQATAGFEERVLLIPDSIRQLAATQHGAVATLIFKLVDPVQGRNVDSVIYIDDIRLSNAGQPLQIESAAGVVGAGQGVPQNTLDSVVEAAQRVWTQLIDMPNWSGGVELRNIGVPAAEFPFVDEGDFQEDGSTGSGERGFNDQFVFTDSDGAFGLPIIPHKQTGSVGISFFNSALFTNQFRVDGDTSFASDGHTVQSQHDTPLLSGQEAILGHVIMNEHVSFHPEIANGGAVIDRLAVPVSIVDFNVSNDFAAQGSSRTVADLDILKNEELSLQQLKSLLPFGRKLNGFVTPTVFANVTASLGQGEDQQDQSVFQHNFSISSPTLPPDRSLVNPSGAFRLGTSFVIRVGLFPVDG